MTASNSTLRKNAYLLYKKHWRTLILISFVTMLPSGIFTLFTHFITTTAVVSRIISFVYHSLLYPITTIGAAYVYLETYCGQAPKISMLFQFCSSSRLWLRTLLLGSIIQLAQQAIPVLIEIRDLFSGNTGAYIGATFIFLIIISVSLWLMIRLTLLPYIYNTEYVSQSTWAIIKDAFYRMKGIAGRFIWFMITLILLFVPIIALLSIVFGNLPQDAWGYTKDKSAQLLLYQVCFGAVSVLWAPYLNLALAGFANEYIRLEKPEPEEDAIPQMQCPSCGEQIDFDYARCPVCHVRLL